MKFLIIIISFLLEGIVSNYIPLNSIFCPLFTLASLIVAYPYFNSDKTLYYKCSFVLGLAYDLIYTDTMIFYAFLFLFISYIITKLSIVLADNYINSIIILMICIILFRVITYILIVMTGNMSFNIHVLFKGIYSSFLANIIYIILLLLITNFIDFKFHIKKKTRY